MDVRTLLDPPEEHVAPTTRRSVVLTTLAICALVGAANVVAFVELDARPRNRGVEVMRHKWALAEAGDVPVDWLFVGDSSCNQGVIPEVIASEAGGTVLNLCTIGTATAADDAWLFAEYADRVGPPGAVVVVHTWDVWQRDARDLRSLLWALPDGWRGREPVPEMGVRDRVVARLGRWLPLYTQSVSVKQALTRPGAAPEIAFDDAGFMPMETGSAYAAASDLRKHRALSDEEPWDVTDWNRRAIETLIDDARRRGVPVYLAMSPIHEELAADADFARWLDGYAVFLTRLAEAPGVTLLADAPFPVAADALEKVDHVTVEGAQLYSGFLGRLLSASAPPPSSTPESADP